MLAAVWKDFDRPVPEDVPMPEPGMQEVVVRVNACGFCATDYTSIQGIDQAVAVMDRPDRNQVLVHP